MDLAPEELSGRDRHVNSYSVWHGKNYILETGTMIWHRVKNIWAENRFHQKKGEGHSRQHNFYVQE